METTQSVPYLNCLNTVEGTSQKPHLLYVTHDGKKELCLKRREFILKQIEGSLTKLLNACKHKKIKSNQINEI